MLIFFPTRDFFLFLALLQLSFCFLPVQSPLASFFSTPSVSVCESLFCLGRHPDQGRVRLEVRPFFFFPQLLLSFHLTFFPPPPNEVTKRIFIRSTQLGLSCLFDVPGDSPSTLVKSQTSLVPQVFFLTLAPPLDTSPGTSEFSPLLPSFTSFPPCHV